MENRTHPSEKLKKLFSDIVAYESGISASEVCYSMALIRQILEIENIYLNFPLLSFYCNWCLHVKLDKPRAKTFLENIFSSLVQFEKESQNMGNKKAFYVSRKMSEKLSSIELQNQFINLLKQFDVQIGGFDNINNWHAFFGGILKIAMGNAIVIPDIQEFYPKENDLYQKALKELKVDKIVKLVFWIEADAYVP